MDFSALSSQLSQTSGSEDIFSPTDTVKKLFDDTKIHSLGVINVFDEIRKDEMLYDFYIEVGSVSIPTHRLLLAACCQFFKGLFHHEPSKGSLKMPDDTGVNNINTLLEYMYTGKFQVDTASVCKLYDISDFLGFSLARNRCIDFLKSMINDHNCFKIMAYADRPGLHDLYDQSHDYCLKNLIRCAHKDEFNGLTIDMLVSLLLDPNLRVYNLHGSYSDTLIDQQKELVMIIVKFLQTFPIYLDLIKDLLDCVKIQLLPETNLRELKKNLVDLGISTSKIDQSLTDHNDLQPDRVKPVILTMKCRPLANGPQIMDPNATHFSFGGKDGAFVTGMHIWIRQWDGRSVLGGMQIFLNDGSQSDIFGDHSGPEEHEFHLNDGEKINNVSASAGWMVDNISFETNFDRTLGPYGGPGGGEKNMWSKISSRVLKIPGLRKGRFLSGINGRCYSTQGQLSIRDLVFIFAFHCFDDIEQNVAGYSPASDSPTSPFNFEDHFHWVQLN